MDEEDGMDGTEITDSTDPQDAGKTSKIYFENLLYIHIGFIE